MSNACVRGRAPAWTSRLLGVGALLGLTLAASAKDPPKGPPPKTSAPFRAPSNREPTKAMNELLAKQWKANKLTPSPRASDHAFIRRVSLDLIGRIATVKEVEDFERDLSPEKRARLVERLLNSKEFARNWSNIWAIWLMTRTANPIHIEQIRVWLEEQFDKGVPYKEVVEKLVTATGKTNGDGDEPAVNFILQHLGEMVPPAKRGEEGMFEMVPITSRTARLFLGLQLQCTQCHDHPFNPDWKQHHFWGINAFFRQVHRDGTPTNRLQAMGAARLTLRDEKGYNPDGILYYEKRNGVVLPTKAAFLDGTKVPADAQNTRREMLAKFLTGHENFPKAFVNRLWGHFFGRGLNEQPTVDDFGEHNQVVHPELLDRLAKDFAGSGGYDPRNLMYWICTSEAYNLSSLANSSNAKADADPFFSRMLLKSMSPEQLFESLWVATRVDEAGEKVKRELRDRWMRRLIVNFGDDEGNETTFNGTVVQALLMMNGKEINDAILSSDKSPVAVAIRKGKNTALRHLFMAALNRPPTPGEISVVNREFSAAKYATIRDRSLPALYQDVFWALLNSNEFILNH